MTRSAIAAGDGAGYRDRFEWPLSSGAYVGSGSIVLKNSSHSTEWSALPKFDLVERPLLNATHAGDGL